MTKLIYTNSGKGQFGFQRRSTMNLSTSCFVAGREVVLSLVLNETNGEEAKCNEKRMLYTKVKFEGKVVIHYTIRENLSFLFC